MCLRSSKIPLLGLILSNFEIWSLITLSIWHVLQRSNKFRTFVINLIKFEALICNFQNNLQNEQKCRLIVQTFMTDRNIMMIFSYACAGIHKLSVFANVYFQKNKLASLKATQVWNLSTSGTRDRKGRETKFKSHCWSTNPWYLLAVLALGLPWQIGYLVYHVIALGTIIGTWCQIRHIFVLSSF